MGFYHFFEDLFLFYWHSDDQHTNWITIFNEGLSFVFEVQLVKFLHLCILVMGINKIDYFSNVLKRGVFSF